MAKNFLPLKALTTLYHSLIESYISYGLIAWGNSSHADNVLKLQKRAMRIIHRKSYTFHTEPLFKSLGVLKCNELYEQQILVFMYDFLNNRLPCSFENFAIFQRDFSNRNSRQQNTFRIGKPRTTFSLKLPNHTFPRVWNKYVNDISFNTGRLSFKKDCKSFFISR